MISVRKSAEDGFMGMYHVEAHLIMERMRWRIGQEIESMLREGKGKSPARDVARGKSNRLEVDATEVVAEKRLRT